MKTNKRQWIFGLGTVALMIVCSLSMPALAERLIAATQDNVQIEAAQAERKHSITTDGSVAALKGYALSDESLAALESQGRMAFQDVFGVEIPADYRPIDRQAYEEEGDMRYTLSLMPSDWEDSIDVLPAPVEQPFYTIQFGNVDILSGEAKLLGLQRFTLNWDQSAPAEAEYSATQVEAMEHEARAFAVEMGMDTLDLAGVDKVSGGFPPGCILTFSMPADKTLSVTVSAKGEVSGYSLVPGKG